MSREERVLTFQRGMAALQAVLDADEATSPDYPEDSETLLFLRDVTGIYARLSMVVDDLMEDDLGDMMVLSFALETEDDVLERCERVLSDGGPYRESADPEASAHIQAIRSLRALLHRYGNGEFIPRDFPGMGHLADG